MAAGQDPLSSEHFFTEQSGVPPVIKSPSSTGEHLSTSNLPTIISRSRITTQILDPRSTKNIIPDHPKDMWLFQAERSDGFRMAISTHAEPQSGDYNCGGLRIVPKQMIVPGFDLGTMALRLGVEMDHKGSFSRLTGIAGPRVRDNFGKFQFGKHVVLPPDGNRVGEEGDLTTMNFIVDGLNAFEREFGAFPITGQDAGHGVLTTGESSLEFLSKLYPGCGSVNTGRVTAYGNFQLLYGMAHGFDLQLRDARVALFGCGNIGQALLDQILTTSIQSVEVCEENSRKREELENVLDPQSVWSPKDKQRLLSAPVDIVVFNTLGGSLDKASVEAICENPRIKFVCGCENLIWPQDSQEVDLLTAGKVMSPTELCGMGGWLYAAEASIATRVGGSDFTEEDMHLPLNALYEVGKKVVLEMRNDLTSRNINSFADTLMRLYNRS